MIKHFRDCVKGAPRELYANVLLTAGPAGKDSLMVVQMCYVGPREKGQEYLAAISSWDGEKCLLNEVDEKSFLHQQDSVAQVLRGKRRVILCHPGFITLIIFIFRGTSMVHPVCPYFLFAGRHHQQNGHPVRRYPRWL